MAFDNILVYTLLLSTVSFSSFNFVSGYNSISDFMFRHATQGILNAAPHLIDRVLNLTVNWVDTHNPLAAKLLTVAQKLTKPALDAIPGALPFLDIVYQTVNKNNGSLLTKDYSNHTLDEVLDDLKDNHNISLSQIPFSPQIGPKELLSVPGLQDLVKESMTTNINGVPFAITLLELTNHLKGEIKMKDFAEIGTIVDVHKNISTVFTPFIKLQVEKHFSKFVNNTVG